MKTNLLIAAAVLSAAVLATGCAYQGAKRGFAYKTGVMEFYCQHEPAKFSLEVPKALIEAITKQDPPTIQRKVQEFYMTNDLENLVSYCQKLIKGESISTPSGNGQATGAAGDDNSSKDESGNAPK